MNQLVPNEWSYIRRLDGNPLHCDCHFNWFFEWSSRALNSTFRLSGSCSSPASIANTTLSAIISKTSSTQICGKKQNNFSKAKNQFFVTLARGLGRRSNFKTMLMFIIYLFYQIHPCHAQNNDLISRQGTIVTPSGYTEG